jgi:hypothetical protein
MKRAGGTFAQGAFPRSAFAGALTAVACVTLLPGMAAAQFGGRAPSIDQIATWAAPGGDPQRASDAILEHVAQERTGERATLWVQLFEVVDKVQPGSAERAVRAVGFGLDGEGVEGAELLMNGAGAAPAAERPALMALAAHLADLEDVARGAEIRRLLVAAHPDATEAPEARLLRARYLLGEDDSSSEALALLEALIVGDPEHPMAPEARRLYEANGPRPSSTPTPSGRPL